MLTAATSFGVFFLFNAPFPVKCVKNILILLALYCLHASVEFPMIHKCVFIVKFSQICQMEFVYSWIVIYSCPEVLHGL